MGMFDKDKEIGAQLQTSFKDGEMFLLFGLSVDPESVQTTLGMADKTTLRVAKLSDPNTRFEVGSLSGAISAKAKEADEADFPCVVFWTTVESKNFPGTRAVVLQWVKQWEGKGEPVTVGANVTPAQTDDDILF